MTVRAMRPANGADFSLADQSSCRRDDEVDYVDGGSDGDRIGSR